MSGLLRAGAAFDYRLPELYSGDAADRVPKPIPYPAACRPQAWSAAAGVSLVRDLLGLEVDVRARRIEVRPMARAPVGGPRRPRPRAVADGTLDVTVDADGGVVRTSAGAGLHLALGQ